MTPALRLSRALLFGGLTLFLGAYAADAAGRLAHAHALLLQCAGMASCGSGVVLTALSLRSAWWRTAAVVGSLQIGTAATTAIVVARRLLE